MNCELGTIILNSRKGNRSDHFIPLRMTVSKNGALGERAGVGTGPYRGAGRSLPSPEGKAPLPALRATFPKGEGLSAGLGASRDGRGF